jgi:predicted lipoprotein with Yx(FWY)xxD motif/glucose/arabinose dehydrogenase
VLIRSVLHHTKMYLGLLGLLGLVLVLVAPSWTAAQELGPTISASLTADGIPTVVGPDGRTLYWFAHDEEGQPTCYEACAEAWPPLILDEGTEPSVGEGVPGQVDTVAREDGSLQVTYNGWPLYYFAQDTAPGEAKGQGLRDIWFAASPATVMMNQADGIGNYLVGPGGMTLYIFTHDHENESYCFADCAVAWPPLLAPEGVELSAGMGITGTDVLSTTMRPDGTRQVTFEGWPLYFFKMDMKPGDMTGQGAKDVWFVALPEELQKEEVSVSVELVAEGLTAPLALKAAPDDSGRLFVADQAGMIWLISADGQLQPEPFLDIHDRMVELTEEVPGGVDERGLLGMAFHPQFAENGRFYIYYSAPLRADAPGGWDHTSHVSEFTVSADSPDQADPASERILLQVDQPEFNHNAGQIEFGPDGFLYIPLGDGGGGNDMDIFLPAPGTNGQPITPTLEVPGHTPELGNGQDLTNMLGSILRIDVDSGDPYGIPADNPFVDAEGTPPETFAYGFRNPFHISFDRMGDGSLYVADAGQELFEEVSIVQAGGNYGWDIREGLHCFNREAPHQPPADCMDTGANGDPLIPPIIEIDHSTGVVIVGGYVYHGTTNPDLQGNYVFATFTAAPTYPSGGLFVAGTGDGQGLWSVNEIQVTNGDEGRVPGFIRALGEDADGELYVLTGTNPAPFGETGQVWRIGAAGEGMGEGEEEGEASEEDVTPEAETPEETPTPTP